MSKSKTKYDLIIPPEIDWSEYEDDKDRIKAYSKRFKNMSIAESFAEVYGKNVIDPLKVNDEMFKAIEHSNLTPVNVGDLIDVDIESISKRDVVVSHLNSKHNFTLKQNIASWNVKPGERLRVSVVEKNKAGDYVVDCIEPIYQDWLDMVSRTLKNTFQSYHVVVTNLERQKGGFTGKINIPEITALTGKPYTIDAFIPGSYIALNVEHDFEKWVGKSVDAMVTNFTSKNGTFSAVCSRKKYLNVHGCKSLINIFDAGYCHGENPQRFDQITFDGVVTGWIWFHEPSKTHSRAIMLW